MAQALQPARAGGADLAAPHARAWWAFALTFALMVLDSVDRPVVVSMFPHLQAAWRLGDAQLGALVSVVSVTVALATLPLSFLADQWGRARSMAWMALVWSAATLACAFASNYGELFVARGLVGLGEAAYGTAGAALLSSLFPARMRSTIIGSFLAAAVVGSTVGVALGGMIAQRWGWQAGFGVVAIPGLLLAPLLFGLVRDDDSGALPRDARIARVSERVRSVALALWEPRSGWITCLAAGLHLVTVSTLYAWLPSYFHRYYDLAPDAAGLKAAVVVLTSGLGAVLFGVLADRLAMRIVCARLYVAAAVPILTATTMTVAFALVPPGTVQYALILAGATVMTGTLGPAAAVVIDVVQPAVRASAAAVLALTQNALGLAAGPLVAGLLSDAHGLAFALAVVPVVGAISAVGFVLAAGTYAGDRARADLTERAREGPPRTPPAPSSRRS